MAGLAQCQSCGAVVDDGTEEETEADNWIACHTSGIGAQCHKCYEASAGLPPPFWPQRLPDAELHRLAVQQGWV